MEKQRILIMAGGTGGHVFPALAVAKEFQKRGDTVEWLGTKQGLEATLIPKAHIPIHYLTVTAFRREGLIKRLLTPFRLLISLMQALKIIHRFKPDLVLGMGGFAAGPGGLAAWLLRRPIAIHEQNAVAGITNRILSRFATKVFEGFPNSFPKNFLKSNDIIYTGNPVREEFFQYPTPEQRFKERVKEQDKEEEIKSQSSPLSSLTASASPSPLRLLIVGGSQGARALNQLCPRAIQNIPEHERPDIWHQAGGGHVDTTLKEYADHQVKARVEAFIDNMAEAYAWADLVICRSGALTVAELAAVGVGSILIPFPFGVDDHQTHNGRFLENIGAALLIPQSALTAEKLTRIIVELSNNRPKLLLMAQAAKKFAKPKAVEEVVEHCKKIM